MNWITLYLYKLVSTSPKDIFCAKTSGRSWNSKFFPCISLFQQNFSPFVHCAQFNERTWTLAKEMLMHSLSKNLIHSRLKGHLRWRGLFWWKKNCVNRFFFLFAYSKMGMSFIIFESIRITFLLYNGDNPLLTTPV